MSEVINVEREVIFEKGTVEWIGPKILPHQFHIKSHLKCW